MDIEAFIRQEQAKLNAHLPRERITLAEALNASEPYVELKNGGRHYFDKKELDLLATALPKDWHSSLRLPMLIRIDRKLGSGTAKLVGLEARVAAKVLNKNESDELILYRPEIMSLRRKLPTTTEYLFVP